MAKLIDAEQMARIKQQVLFRDFEKINSVMSGRQVKVAENKRPAYYQQPPAWSQLVTGGARPAHEVVFSTTNKAFDVESVEGVIGVTGLNYHELAHVLYSQGAALPKVHPAQLPIIVLRKKVDYANSPRMKMIRAIFEDMRIERKFIEEYGPTKPYFQSVVGRFLLNTTDEQAKDRQYLLLAARTYVDKSIREIYRQRFAEATSEKVATAYKALAMEFAALDFETKDDISTGFKLIRKASLLLSNDDLSNASKDSPFHGGTETCTPGQDAGDEGGQEQAQNLRPHDDVSEDAQEEIADMVLGGEKSDEEDDEESASGTSGSEDDEEGEDEEDEEGEGTGAGGGDDEDDDSNEGADGDGDASDDDDVADGGNAGESEEDVEGEGAGSGLTKGESEADDGDDPVEQMIERAESNEAVLEEVAQKQRSLRNLDRPGQSLLLGSRTSSRYMHPVESDMTLISKRVSQQFRQLQVDLDPGRKPYQPSGVVSMKRAMKGVDYDTVFDSWDEGQQDASDMEVVILADLSGSMSPHASEMSKTLWVIQRAIQMASASSCVSLIGYGSESGYLSPRGEKANPLKFTNHPCMDSGTAPLSAIKEAVALFATTKKQKRVLITLTDGLWDDITECDEEFARMDEAGVVTSVFLFVGSFHVQQFIQSMPNPADRAKSLGHGARIYQESTHMTDLIGFSKKVVTTAMKEH